MKKDLVNQKGRYIFALSITTKPKKMTNLTKLRDEWRALNLKLIQIDRVIKMNKITDIEYLNWVSDLIARRDYLTTII